MASYSIIKEVAFGFDIVKIYEDGRVERLLGEDFVPASLDSTTNVESKDVVISKEEGISARLFIPKTTYPPKTKLPVFVYLHGGAFAIESPFSPAYHRFLNTVVSQANVIGVSVHYRRAPEHPVPIPHEDSWAALKWTASHVGGNGFLAGDSAGANIAHYLGIRVGTEGLDGVKIEGIVLIHPYFWGGERIGIEKDHAERAEQVEPLWRFACPNTSGSDDSMFNPEKDPKLGKLGCGRVVVFVAEKDLFRERGWFYKEALEKSGWDGVVEVMEAKEEDHVFHMFKPTCENALALFTKLVQFINH